MPGVEWCIRVEIDARVLSNPLSPYIRKKFVIVFFVV